MMALLITRFVALWDDYLFFRINVVVLVTGVLYLLFAS
jgi:hypothetical protein